MGEVKKPWEQNLKTEDAVSVKPWEQNLTSDDVKKNSTPNQDGQDLKNTSVQSGLGIQSTGKSIDTQKTQDIMGIGKDLGVPIKVIKPINVPHAQDVHYNEVKDLSTQQAQKEIAKIESQIKAGGREVDKTNVQGVFTGKEFAKFNQAELADMQLKLQTLKSQQQFIEDKKIKDVQDASFLYGVPVTALTPDQYHDFKKVHYGLEDDVTGFSSPEKLYKKEVNKITDLKEGLVSLAKKAKQSIAETYGADYLKKYNDIQAELVRQFGLNPKIKSLDEQASKLEQQAQEKMQSFALKYKHDVDPATTIEGKEAIAIQKQADALKAQSEELKKPIVEKQVEFSEMRNNPHIQQLNALEDKNIALNQNYNIALANNPTMLKIEEGKQATQQHIDEINKMFDKHPVMGTLGKILFNGSLNITNTLAKTIESGTTLPRTFTGQFTNDVPDFIKALADVGEGINETIHAPDATKNQLGILQKEINYKGYKLLVDDNGNLDVRDKDRYKVDEQQAQKIVDEFNADPKKEEYKPESQPKMNQIKTAINSAYKMLPDLMVMSAMGGGFGSVGLKGSALKETINGTLVLTAFSHNDAYKAAEDAGDALTTEEKARYALWSSVATAATLTMLGGTMSKFITGNEESAVGKFLNEFKGKNPFALTTQEVEALAAKKIPITQIAKEKVLGILDRSVSDIATFGIALPAVQSISNAAFNQAVDGKGYMDTEIDGKENMESVISMMPLAFMMGATHGNRIPKYQREGFYKAVNSTGGTLQMFDMLDAAVKNGVADANRVEYLKKKILTVQQKMTPYNTESEKFRENMTNLFGIKHDVESKLETYYDEAAKKPLKETLKQIDGEIAELALTKDDSFRSGIFAGVDDYAKLMAEKKAEEEALKPKPKTEFTPATDVNIQSQDFDVADTEYNDFVDNGKVSPERTKDIEKKIEDGVALTDKEQEMRDAVGDVKTVAELLDKSVTYNGQKGLLIQYGQAVIFKPEGGGAERELEGSIEQIGNRPAKELGIEHNDSVVTTNENGDIFVRGEKFNNQSYSDPFAAINRDKDGNVISVTLDGENGKKRTFRGETGQDLAYQIYLKETLKDNGTTKEFENFLAEEEQQLELNKVQETSTTETDKVDAEIPREKTVAFSEGVNGNGQGAAKATPAILGDKYDLIDRSYATGDVKSQRRTSKRANAAGITEDKVYYDRTSDALASQLARDIVSEALANPTNGNDLKKTIEDLHKEIRNAKASDAKEDSPHPHLTFVSAKIYSELQNKAVRSGNQELIDRANKLYAENATDAMKVGGAMSNDPYAGILGKAKQDAEVQKEKVMNEKQENGKTGQQNFDEVVSNVTDEAKAAVQEALNNPKSKLSKAIQEIVDPKAKPEKKETGKKTKKEIKDEIANLKDKIKQQWQDSRNLHAVFDPKREAQKQYDFHKNLVDLAKKYIELGIENLKDFAKEIGLPHKDVEKAWNEATGLNSYKLEDFEDKSNHISIESVASTIVGEKLASDKLADAIIKHEKPQGEKKEKSEEDKLVEALIGKYKSENKKDLPKEEKDVLSEVAERVRQNDIADEMWDFAFNKVSQEIDNDVTLSDAEKADKKNKLEDYIAGAKGSPFRKSEARKINSQRFAENKDALKTKIAEMAKSHFEDNNKTAQDFVTKLMDEVGLSKEEAETLSAAIENDIKDRVEKAAEQTFKAQGRKIENKKNGVVGNKPATPIQVAVNNILKYGNLSPANQAKYAPLYSAMGIPHGNSAVIAQMQNLARAIQLSKGRNTKLLQAQFNRLMIEQKQPGVKATLKFWASISEMFMTNILGSPVTAIRNIIAAQQTVLDSIGTQSIVDFLHGRKIDFKNEYKIKGDSLGKRLKDVYQSIKNVDTQNTDVFKYDKGVKSYLFEYQFTGKNKVLKTIFRDLLMGEMYASRSLAVMDAFFSERVKFNEIYRVAKKILKEQNVDPATFEYMDKLNEMIGNTDEIKNSVETQYQKEMTDLSSLGIKLSDYDKSRRKAEILDEHLTQTAELANYRATSALLHGGQRLLPLPFVYLATKLREFGEPKVKELLEKDVLNKKDIAQLNAIKAAEFMGTTIIPIINIPMRALALGMDYVPVISTLQSLADKSLAESYYKKKGGFVFDGDEYARRNVRQAVGALATIGMMGTLFTKGDDGDEKNWLKFNTKNIRVWGKYDQELKSNLGEQYQENSISIKVGDKWHHFNYRDMPFGLSLFGIGNISNTIAKRDLYKGTSKEESDDYLNAVKEMDRDRISIYFVNTLGATSTWLSEQRYLQGFSQALLAFQQNDKPDKVKDAVYKLFTTPLNASPTHNNYYKFIENLYDNKLEAKRKSDSYAQGFANYAVNNSALSFIGDRPHTTDALGNDLYKKEDFGIFGGWYKGQLINGFTTLTPEAQKSWDFINENTLFINSKAMWRKMHDFVKPIMTNKELAKQVTEEYIGTYGKNIPNEKNLPDAIADMFYEKSAKKLGELVKDFVGTEGTKEELQDQLDALRKQATDMVIENYIGDIKADRAEKKARDAEKNQ